MKRWREGADPLKQLLVDKVVLVLPLTKVEGQQEDEAEELGRRLKGAGFLRLPPTSTFYGRVDSKRLKSGASFVVTSLPKGGRMNHSMAITLNPALIEEQDLPRLRKCFRACLGGNWKIRMADLLIYRVDVCRDAVGVHVANLMAIKTRGVAETKFVLQTDKGGELQTMYLGSIEADQRAAIYDQNASDDFKALVNEKVADKEWQPKRTRLQWKNDAANIIASVPRSDRTRVEVRNVLNPPRPLAACGDVATFTEKVRVFLIPSKVERDEKKVMFWLYLESVRMRGRVGARKHLTARFPGKKMSQSLLQWEARLDTFEVPWWPVDSDHMSLAQALEMHPAGKVLKYLDRRAADLGAGGRKTHQRMNARSHGR